MVSENLSFESLPKAMPLTADCFGLVVGGAERSSEKFTLKLSFQSVRHCER